MPTPNHATHAAPPTPADEAEPDMPAVIVALETVSELADLVHRHRLTVARLRQRLSELTDELSRREAQAVLAAEGPNAEQRKAAATLRLSADADYQALRAKERDLRRELAELHADIERATLRIRITLALLPVAEAVDALSSDGSGDRELAADDGSDGEADGNGPPAETEPRERA